MNMAILGMGTATPATAVTQEEALRVAQAMCRSPEKRSWLPGIYQGTRIARRHMVLPQALVRDLVNGTTISDSVFLPGRIDERGPTTGQRMAIYATEAPRLAAAACRQALADADVAPERVTHLITVSCTGFVAPGVDCRLIESLGLSTGVERTHIGFMGCHGALNGLRLANAFVGSAEKTVVLLIAVELCSLHYDYAGEAGQLVANAIFADGAGALVAGAREGAWRLGRSGSCLIPDSRGAMTWTVGDHGFVMTLSKQTPAWVKRHLRPWLEGWLAGAGLGLDDIRSWAIHPGGPRILEAAREALGLRSEDTAVSEAVFVENGNMSSPTLLFVLHALRRRNAPRPCVALGFGPGLTIEAALFF